MTAAEILEKIHAAQNCGTSGCRCAKPGMTHCPAHADHTPSLSLRLGDGKVLVNCKGGCSQDDVIEALRERGLWPSKSTSNGATRPKRTIVRTYDYRDAAGQLAFQVVRYQPKDFRQRRPDGNGGWTWNLNGQKPILYHLPELIAAPTSAAVLMVEGEKDVETAESLGLISTSTPMGATKAHLCDLSPLRGREVVLVEDDDEPGHKHAAQVDQLVRAIGAAKVTRITLPEHDLSDYVAAGSSRADLDQLIAAAASYTAPQAPDLAELLDDVVAFVRRYAVVDDQQAAAIALWLAHTWALDVADATPYLQVTSAEKRSGKSRLLETLSCLAAKPWLTDRVSTAVLVRRMDRDQPTLLLDESDAAFKGEKEYAEALRGVLNGGHRRGGVASLCVGQGSKLELVDFSVFGPKAIAGIGKLPGTLADRSIAINMRRRRPNERVARFRLAKAKAESAAVRAALAAWTASAVQVLRDAEPALPNELDDRAADGWEPLLAIADLAGGEWPSRARRSGIALSVGDNRDDDSDGVRLLIDIRAVFDENDVERFSSADLCSGLIKIEESPWGDLRGRQLDARGLAARLRPFGVKPHKIRFGDTTLNGYERADFDDAWVRYAPSFTTPREPEQPEQPEQTPDSDSANVPDVPDVPANTGVAEEVAGASWETL